MDKSRCPICGRPNGCAMERAKAEEPGDEGAPARPAGIPAPPGTSPSGRSGAGHPPCWCLERRVPRRLTALLDLVAASRGGERACACPACVDYFEAAEREAAAPSRGSPD